MYKNVYVLCLVFFLLSGNVFAKAVNEKSEAGTYDYPLKKRWEERRIPGGYWLTGVGSIKRGYDFNALVNSPIGEEIMNNFVTFLDYKDDMDPALVAEWISRGIRKEVFNYGDPDNNWAVYTPVGAFEAGNTRNYPVVFCLHGAGNSILMAETYGYAKLGASEGFITVIPYSNNHETIIPDMALMMDKLKKDFPIDESRIYAAGYSLGGMASLKLALAYPALFAAIAPGGCSLDGFGAISASDPGWEILEKHGMPLVNLFGTLDFYEYYPMKAESEAALVYEKWLAINHINAELSPSVVNTALLSKNRVEQETGAPFQKTYTQVYETDYHIGQYINEKRQPVFEVVAIEDLPHWPSGAFAEVAWDFLRHWSRDPQTKELVYSDLGQGYTGLLENKATFENLEETRISGPKDVATYYGNEAQKWISHPLLDDYPEGIAFVYRASNSYGGRTAWRNNTNFVVFVDRHFEQKSDARTWLETTGLIELIEEAKGSILIITPINSKEGFGSQDAELYYNIQTAQCAVGVETTINNERVTFADGEYYGGFALKYAIGINGGAAFYNDYIATHEDYMSRFAGTVLINGSMKPESAVKNLMPVYIAGEDKTAIEKYREANKSEKNIIESPEKIIYGSSVNEAAQVIVSKQPQIPLRAAIRDAYYSLLVHTMRQPVGKRALLTQGMPYNNYVCDQAPYSLSLRDYYTGTSPSSPDVSRAETNTGIMQINRFNQTRFKPFKDSTGHYIDTWFEYVPSEVLSGKTVVNSVPLVVVLHGRDDDMRAVVNQVGWLKLAGEKRFIMVAPDHQFLASEAEKSEAFLKLIDYMIETYPSIDKSRIYVTGYSLGGSATLDTIMYHPERYAAAAPMAPPLLLSDLTLEIRAAYTKYDIPIFYYTSTLDTLVAFADGRLNTGQQTLLNLLMPANELPQLGYDFNKYPVFGFQGEINETYTLNNEYSAGSFTFQKEGLPLFVYSYVKDIIHALWFKEAELAWNYMSRFSRDPQTLELKYR